MKWVCLDCGYETTLPRHGKDAIHANGVYYHLGCEKTENTCGGKFSCVRDKQEVSRQSESSV